MSKSKVEMKTKADNRLGFNGSHVRGPIMPATVDPQSTLVESHAYPEVPFGAGLTIQIAMLTPELAAELKAKIDEERQRNLRQLHIKTLVDDIVNGRWKFNGEPIIIDRNDRVINGHHRIVSVLLTEQSIPVVIIRGVDPKVYASLDGGAKRLGQDALRHQSSNPAVHSGALVKLYKYMTTGHPNNPGGISPQAHAELSEEHPEMVHSVALAVMSARITHHPSAMAFLHYVFSTRDREAADTFANLVATGENLPPGNPILALRRRLAEERWTDSEFIQLTIRAWNFWREGRKVNLLRFYRDSPIPPVAD